MTQLTFRRWRNKRPPSGSADGSAGIERGPYPVAILRSLVIRLVPYPRPEEAAQPIALRPRHYVRMQVRHALADDVVDGDEAALCPERLRQRGADQLNGLKVGCEQFAGKV